MKKIILSAIMLMGLAFTAQAQDISKNALGLRFGDSGGFGAELSYQRGLSANNRLELDLGWRNRSNFNNNDYDDSAIKLTGLYQWVFPLNGDFNWYVGAGVGGASFSGNKNSNFDNETGFFVAGDIGVEYSFDVPLQLSLDFKPDNIMSWNGNIVMIDW